MKTYTKESWKYMSTEVIWGGKENLIHFFIKKRFQNALRFFLHEVLNKGELRKLCFQTDSINRIPLMTSIRQGMESSAIVTRLQFHSFHQFPKFLHELLHFCGEIFFDFFYVNIIVYQT